MVSRHLTVGIDSVNRFVLKKQHLAEEAKMGGAEQITRDVGGLHATNVTTPYLSLLARSGDFARSELHNKLYTAKTLAKVTFVRRTLFILPAEMLPVAFAAVRGNARTLTSQHLKYLQMSQTEFERIAQRVFRALESRGLTLNEMKSEVENIPNLMYVVRMMCFQGLLIRGAPRSGWKNSQHSYHIFQEIYPGVDIFSHDEEEAQKLLVLHYISSFGPVTFTDVAWWTGFPKTLVKNILNKIEDKLCVLEIPALEGPFFILASQQEELLSPAPHTFNPLNCLPCMDPLLMGYKERERYLEPEKTRYIFDLSGNATSTIFFKGKAIGVWDYEAPVLKYFLFKGSGKEILKPLESEAARIGQLLSESDIQLKACFSMRPLNQRTAGGVLSPLKNS